MSSPTVKYFLLTEKDLEQIQEKQPKPKAMEQNELKDPQKNENMSNLPYPGPLSPIQGLLADLDALNKSDSSAEKKWEDYHTLLRKYAYFLSPARNQSNIHHLSSEADPTLSQNI